MSADHRGPASSGRLRVLLLFGTDMLSSFADARPVAAGLARHDLVVSYDLFMNDTARRYADVVLPAHVLARGARVQEHQHAPLPDAEGALSPPGETRPLAWVLRELARRLGVADFFPWASETGPLDAILDIRHRARHRGSARDRGWHPRAAGLACRASGPAFDTPSGKIELFSERAACLGLPPLPVHDACRDVGLVRSSLRQGRTLTHFHAFYDHGRALPTLATADPEPRLWISPADAAHATIADGDAIRIYNERGEMRARAHVTDAVPAGTVWMRDGWAGLNTLTSGAPVLPDAAVDLFPSFSGGQAEFETRVEVVRADPG